MFHPGDTTDCGDELAPCIALRGEHLRALRREAVVPAAALAGLLDPPAVNPPALLEAFERLYGQYVRMVHAILLGRVPRRDVDDLVQDVFLTAYARLGQLRNPVAAGAWLARIARNRGTDYLRQTREQVALPDDLPGG